MCSLNIAPRLLRETMKLYILLCIVLAVANARPFVESQPNDLEYFTLEREDSLELDALERSDVVGEGLILNQASVDTTGIALPPIGTPGVVGTGALQVIINVMAADPNNVVVTTNR